jgi:hypothetical protein
LKTHDALFGNKSLRITYRTAEAEGKHCDYWLKPLALSYQNSNVYLSCFVVRKKWLDGNLPTVGRQPGKFEGKPNTLCALALHRTDNVKEYWGRSLTHRVMTSILLLHKRS